MTVRNLIDAVDRRIENRKVRLTADEAVLLSERLYRLGEVGPLLLTELKKRGFGEPICVWREALKEFAGSPDAYQQVERYWIEFAKEVLASLKGPMDILLGKLPPFSAYRSEFLDQLRQSAAKGILISDKSIVSPQIEPTIKRLVETMPDDPFNIVTTRRTSEARRDAVTALHLSELPEFWLTDKKRRYGFLVERYKRSFEPLKLTMGVLHRYGVVFRKKSSNGLWDLAVVDQSPDNMYAGPISILIAVTRPRIEIDPGDVRATTVTFFAPEELVPGFPTACRFDTRSYAEFCLACDTNTAFAAMVLPRIDALLAQSRP